MTQKKVSFLPWLRLGISNKISDSDAFLTGGNSALTSPRIDLLVDININLLKIDGLTDDQTASKNINLLGSGDIKMLNPKEIKLAKPVSGENEFDYNHLAFIEFNSPDLPWRYTPSKPTVPSNGSLAVLRPWLSLVVLKSEEFTRIAFNGICSPIQLTDDGEQYGVFIPHEQIYAWGHVQVDGDVTASGTYTTTTEFIQKMQEIVANNKTKAFSRIICPRRLEANTQYHAFLIPTFEVGRKAGLKQEVLATDDGLAPAWKYNSATPKTLDKTLPTDKIEFPVYYEWSFRTSVDADFETLARRIEAKGVEDYLPEKLCLSDAHPALKGKLPVKVEPGIVLPSILKPVGTTNITNWTLDNNEFVEELRSLINKHDAISSTVQSYSGDPIITPPIYGKWHAKESKIESPSSHPDWLQEINLDPRYRALAGVGAEVIRKNQEYLMDMAWKDIDRVITANKKLTAFQISQQVLDQQYKRRFFSNTSSNNALTVLSVGEYVHKNILNADKTKTVHFDLKSSNLPNGIFSGRMRALMAKGGKMAKSFSPNAPISSVSDWFNQISNNTVSVSESFSTPSGMNSLSVLNSNQLKSSYIESTISQKSDFVLTKPGFTPSVFTVGNDNSQADYLRTKLSEINLENFEFIDGLPQVSTLSNPDISAAAAEIHSGINPKTCITEKANKTVLMTDENTQAAYSFTVIDKIMAVPQMKFSLSEPLYDMEADYIIPNLSGILKNNTAIAFEIDYKALEAYMLGANVEMAKELLWRGYPTDQRGTYFGYFWRTIGANYKDIKPIHTWLDGSNLSTLGENNPGTSGSEPSYLVIALRGDLLKKYPNPIVYMKKAIRNATDSNIIEVSQDLNLRKVPDFYAPFGNDTIFIGFKNLTATEAREGSDELGWFFTINESPSGMRFGLDEFDDSVNLTSNISDWDNLQWGHMEQNNNVTFVDISISPPVSALSPPNSFFWKRSAADMATILYRAQSEIALHAKLLIHI